MSYLIAQMFFYLLIAFILGIVIGRLWSKVLKPTIQPPPENELTECQAQLEKLRAEHNHCPSRLAKAQRDLQSAREDLKRVESRNEVLKKSHPALQQSSKKLADTPYLDTGDSTAMEMAYQVALDRANRLQEMLGQYQAELAHREGSTSTPPSNLKEQPPHAVDNLEMIAGISPTIHKKLNELGIYQFEQLAGFSEMDLTWVANKLGLSKTRIHRAGWVRQAQDLYNTKHDHQG